MFDRVCAWKFVARSYVQGPDFGLTLVTGATRFFPQTPSGASRLSTHMSPPTAPVPAVAAVLPAVGLTGLSRETELFEPIVPGLAG